MGSRSPPALSFVLGVGGGQVKVYNKALAQIPLVNLSSLETEKTTQSKREKTVSKWTTGIPTLRLCSHLAWRIFPWLFHCTWPNPYLQTSPAFLPRASFIPHPHPPRDWTCCKWLSWVVRLCTQVSSLTSSDLTGMCLFFPNMTISFLKWNSAIDKMMYIDFPENVLSSILWWHK